MKFLYLGILITSYADLREEVNTPTNKTATVSGTLRDMISRNKDLTTRSKTRIYKPCIRSIIVHSKETRADTKKPISYRERTKS